MYKYLSATALVCLLATSPAFAQTATGTGVGVSNSESNSAAGAVAVSGQGGRGGNSSLTINNPAQTTSTVNQNVSGTTTQNINQKLSGSTRTETVASGTQTIKNVPSMVAPGLAAAGLETCLGSASGGVSAVGFGISGGSTYKDEDCTARLDARTLFSVGLKAAGVARLCARPDIWRSMPDICQRYWPVGVALPHGIVTVTPVGYAAPVGGPLVAPRPEYGRPYAMGGEAMEVIDGKTGLTRPCNDYNSVRQKCLNWADGNNKPTKLASSKPKKSAVVVTAGPAPATAAGNSVTASAVTPKKEN